jgi:outer membrane lipoprotein SlyB
MKTSNVIPVIFMAALTLISGCAQTDTRREYPQYAHSRVIYGVINHIEVIRENNNDIGAGAVIGGVVGGIIGHQVGRGSGNDLATIAGVAGGAVVGHQIEKNNPQEAYRIRIHLERGGYQTVTQSVSDLRIGDHVRIENNVVSRN